MPSAIERASGRASLISLRSVAGLSLAAGSFSVVVEAMRSCRGAGAAAQGKCGGRRLRGRCGSLPALRCQSEYPRVAARRSLWFAEL